MEWARTKISDHAAGVDKREGSFFAAGEEMKEKTLNEFQERFRRPSGTKTWQQSSLIGEEMRLFHAVKECGTRTRIAAHRLRLAMAEPPFINGGFCISARRISERDQKGNRMQQGRKGDR
ncbi:MAG: hypothetical protein FNP40_04065 [Dehalobacter sp. 4CP]|nr:hypothetical protein [Dehalobacter sp. 4CP]